jgi:chromosome segregation ATPase
MAISWLVVGEAYLKMSVAELNRDVKRKLEPLEKEARQIRKRLDEIEGEIRRYVRALGQGKLSIGRLERRNRRFRNGQGLAEKAIGRNRVKDK